jgi:hypothetical protein
MNMDAFPEMVQGADFGLAMPGGYDDWGSVEGSLFDYDQSEAFSPWDENGVITFGTPELDAGTWNQQTTDFTCAVVSQQNILTSYGIEVSEAQLVYDATVNGWLSNEGTSLGDAGELLNHYGIPTHSVQDASIDDLAAELAQGNKVIVGLDSGELWGTDSPGEDALIGEMADHAVQVTGITKDASGQVFVHINDSGVPDGSGAVYEWERFSDAWADGGNSYVATDHAPEGTVDSVEPVLAASAAASPQTGQGNSIMDVPLTDLAAKTLNATGEWLSSPDGSMAVGAGIAAWAGMPFLAPVIGDGISSLTDAFRNEFARQI